MKKIIQLSMLAALTSSSLVYAGGMGDTTCGGGACNSAFFALEGGYTWNSIGSNDFSLIGLNSTFSAKKTTDAYSGRLAAGMINMMDDQWAFTGEVGWGYYGRNTLSAVNSGVLIVGADNFLVVKHNLSGFDALVGLAYIQPTFDIFLKAGALIQNMQTHVEANFAPFGFPLLDRIDAKSNSTAVLPEIKVGLGYNINSNWTITASYLVAVGASPKMSGTFNVDTLQSTLLVNSQNPTINAALIGVQYTI